MVDAGGSPVFLKQGPTQFNKGINVTGDEETRSQNLVRKRHIVLLLPVFKKALNACAIFQMRLQMQYADGNGRNIGHANA